MTTEVTVESTIEVTIEEIAALLSEIHHKAIMQIKTYLSHFMLDNYVSIHDLQNKNPSYEELANLFRNLSKFTGLLVDGCDHQSDPLIDNLRINIEHIATTAEAISEAINNGNEVSIKHHANRMREFT